MPIEVKTFLTNKSKMVLTNGNKKDCPTCIWNKRIPNTEIEKFQKLIEAKYKKNFESHWEFHRWTCDYFAQYWEEVWNYLGVIYSKPYHEVYKKIGEGFLDCEWFRGATFNFAENALRIRDDRLALICLDVEGKEEFITYAEMFEEVKLYAAAFRKHGLKIGDRVAYYMSNRKETIFAYLAAASIGAINGGPHPYLGVKVASKIVNEIKPKFLMSIDHHSDGTDLHSNINHLTEIVNNTPSLEKVIIVASCEDTKTRDLSHIKNSILLEDFLKSGKSEDGNVPAMKFEQLPFNHPLCINFTSGTTGNPKGPVHSAGTFITNLASQIFCWNMQNGDVVYQFFPTGLSPWDSFLPCLSRGVTLLLYSGCPLHQRPGCNVWDIFTKYKVTYTFFSTSIVEKMEKDYILPGPNSNLEHLRFINVGGAPVKAQNCVFLQNKVKKDMFICSFYGGTEIFGNFSGSNLNLPCYAGEVQAPGLGTNVQCFDPDGNSVVNKRGEMVITTPTPALPIYIWNDDDNKILKQTYLSKYPGVWCQNDQIWINPLTNGIVVVGRSDDILIQNGGRISPADVYLAIYDMEEIKDSICVAQTSADGDCRTVLFLQMNQGYPFTQKFKAKVSRKIADAVWKRNVPQVILETKGIPYNLNNKKMESVVRKVIATNQVPEVSNIKNPHCLKYYCDIPELVKYN